MLSSIENYLYNGLGFVQFLLAPFVVFVIQFFCFVFAINIISKNKT